jgi:hypothetical protein
MDFLGVEGKGRNTALTETAGEIYVATFPVTTGDRHEPRNLTGRCKRGKRDVVSNRTRN